MNLVDWVLVGAVIVFAVAGWQRGFVQGALSFAGFLAGGIVGALVLPAVVARTDLAGLAKAVIVAVGVLVLAIAGQVGASVLGRMIRGTLTWTPVRVVDNAGGAALNVLALAVVTWIVASAFAFLPASPVSQQLSESRTLVALDSLVPPPVRNAFGSLRELVGTTDVPRIFSGLAQITGPDVAEPDTDLSDPGIAAARESIVRIAGSAPACESAVTGSGFVVAPGRVLTNAHVVAGVPEPVVRVRAGDEGQSATVVYFDPQTDVAVLAVPGLVAPDLPLLVETAGSGDPAVVAGFPEGGPFQAEPARIRTVVDASGDDIYGRAGVEREVYVFRGLVRPGNSGGPLLDPQGRALGMVFGASEDDQEVGYALTARELLPALASESSTPVDTGSCRLR